MYINSLKMLLKLDDASLYEEISATYASEIANGSVVSPNILDDGAGYVMQDDQYMFGNGLTNNGYNLGVSTDMTLGFWLYPNNYGFASHPTTGVAESITMPLLSLLRSSDDYSLLVVEEHTDSDNENFLSLSFNDGAYVANSENYEAGMWHMVWLTYDGSLIKLYLDGVLHTLSDTGSLPPSISASLVDLYVNYRSSYTYKIAKNNGYINDIFVLDVANDTIADIQKVANNGIESLVNTDVNTKSIDSYNIYYNDPETITITSFIDDMSYVYIGRNDGIIMRGSPLLWEVRKSYADDNEEDLLELTTSQKENNGISSNGFLEIKSAMVRL